MSASRWDPFRELNTLQDRMNRLFEEASRGRRGGEPSGSTSWSPAVDIYETESEIVVKAELPGLDRKDIVLNLEKNLLTLSGNRPFDKAAKEESYHRIERSYGAFSRTFTIPVVVSESDIRADYKEGVLTIVLPKTERARARQIQIGT